MPRFREGKQTFLTVAALVAYSEVVNRSKDEVEITALNKDFNWTPGSTLAHDGVSVIEQTSESLNGRWLAPVATIMQTTGTIAVPSFDNGQTEVLTGTILGLPVGTPVNITVTNADVAYAGAAIPDLIRYDFTETIKVANTVEVQVWNETDTDDTTAFTMDILVKKL